MSMLGYSAGTEVVEGTWGREGNCKSDDNAIHKIRNVYVNGYMMFQSTRMCADTMP